MSAGFGGGRAVGVRLRARARGVHHQQAARLRHEASPLAQDQDAQGPQVPDQQEGPTGRGPSRRKSYITYLTSWIWLTPSISSHFVFSNPPRRLVPSSSRPPFFL